MHAVAAQSNALHELHCIDCKNCTGPLHPKCESSVTLLPDCNAACKCYALLDVTLNGYIAHICAVCGKLPSTRMLHAKEHAV